MDGVEFAAGTVIRPGAAKMTGVPRVFPFWLLLLCAGGQWLPAQPATREQSIQEERRRRAAELAPERVSKWEERLRLINENRIPQRLSYGFNGLRAKAGGLVTGGGFAIGPEYFREDLLDGNLTAKASYQISVRGFHRAVAQLEAPRLARGRLAAEFLAMHHLYPGLQYYGPGPDSLITGRSNFLLEDASADWSLGATPHKSVLIGGSAGLLWINVGAGRDRRFASAPDLYTPQVAPGIDRQTSFFRYGAFARINKLDNAAGPRQGGYYLFQFNRYDDRRLARYGFNLAEVELRQYIPLYNQRRVIALRARTVLTDTRAGEVTPFYLQPWLGGSDDLRGFRPFRFRDRNSFVFNAEYRWEVFSGLDMAVFTDAGKVFPRLSQLNFTRLETSVGFGFRANVRNQTFMRIDVGFSREGYQVWFKFNDVFPPRTLGSSATQPYQ
jgi:hypothetical protein